MKNITAFEVLFETCKELITPPDKLETVTIESFRQELGNNIALKGILEAMERYADLKLDDSLKTS